MLNVLFVVVVALSAVTGCVTKRHAVRMAKDAAETAVAIVKTAKDVECAAKTAEYQERLRKFNQLNDDGSLR